MAATREMCPNLREAIDEVVEFFYGEPQHFGKCHRVCQECHSANVVGNRFVDEDDRVVVELVTDGEENCTLQTTIVAANIEG